MIDHHEEPWEAEISSLLGGMGSVDVPEGFLSAAVDRPPAAAGRALGVLVVAVVALGVLGIATGLTNTSLSISPDFTALETRHRAVDAASAAGVDATDAELPPGVPEGFVLVDRLDDGAWDHEVVARASGAVSVFRQAGTLDVDELGTDGSGSAGEWNTVGSTEVWATDAGVVMFEHEDEVFVVVGLQADELVEPAPSSLADRVGGFVGDLTRELGFPS